MCSGHSLQLFLHILDTLGEKNNTEPVLGQVGGVEVRLVNLQIRPPANLQTSNIVFRMYRFD